MCPTTKILILNWPRTQKFSQLLQAGKYSSFWLFSPWSRVGHTLRPIFMLWLVKIWQVSSWNLFALTAEVQRVLCQLVMFVTAFFYWLYKKWNSADIKSLPLFVASLLNGFLVKEYVACQSRKSDLGRHRFRFSPCLMLKRVEKSEAFLALLDSFQELHLEWYTWVIIVFDVCFLYLI